MAHVLSLSSARHQDRVPHTNGHGCLQPAEDLFVGRERELAGLQASLRDACTGRGQLVLVAGEPGIGKTRLLRELGARAGERGHLVLAGSASEFELDLPFSVFVDALEE